MNQQLQVSVPVKNWGAQSVIVMELPYRIATFTIINTSKRNRTRRRGTNTGGGRLRLMSRERGRAVVPRTGHKRGWTTMSWANRQSINVYLTPYEDPHRPYKRGGMPSFQKEVICEVSQGLYDQQGRLGMQDCRSCEAMHAGKR